MHELYTWTLCMDFMHGLYAWTLCMALLDYEKAFDFVKMSAVMKTIRNQRVEKYM